MAPIQVVPERDGTFRSTVVVEPPDGLTELLRDVD